MSIFLPIDSPAFAILRDEEYDVRPEQDAGGEALRILLVNQMPPRVQAETETQWGRLLAGASSNIRLTIAVPDGTVPHEPIGRRREYPVWSAVKNNSFDGLILTGANLEQKKPAEIPTWSCLQDILGWSKGLNGSLFACWAAQIALEHDYAIQKRMAESKLFGVYAQELLTPKSSFFSWHLHQDLREINDLSLPVSRFSYIDREEVRQKAPSLEIMLDSQETHPGLLCATDCSRIYSFNHPEYDRSTLRDEYTRDLLLNKNTARPSSYDDDIAGGTEAPPWRPTGQIIVNHWVGHLAALAKLDYAI